MFTIKFWKLATERAVKSGAQAVLLGLGFSETGPANLFEFDVKLGLGFAAGGMVLSYLTSIVTAPMGGDPESPSLIPGG